MGVQGLTTYVEGNRNFLQDVNFRDSCLVIDGCSLYYCLYFNNHLDQKHGGDYDAFALLLSQFLSALAACNIQPYVVLDGGVDPSEKKLSTIRQRVQSKIKEADSLAHGRNGSVLPILVRDVFIQVLIQRGVPLVQCLFEADKEIACLAHQWKCPVLSNDSDFYIFDLPGGYFPLHYFQWTNLRGKASHRYVAARHYTTAGLCRWFGGMNKALLPLCAVLSGNDYSTPRGVDELLRLVEGDPRRGRGKAVPRIESVLVWLSSFQNPKEALDEVGRLVKNEGGSPGLKSELGEGMQEYYLPPHSPLALWFSESRSIPGEWKAALPACFSRAGAQGLLPPMVVNTMVTKRVILPPQVENSKLGSSHGCAAALRQATYGILLREGGGEAAGGGGRGRRGGRGRGGRGRGFSAPMQPGGHAVESVPVYVEEYDRVDLNLKKNQVEARPPTNPLYLDTPKQASVATRLCVFLEALGIKESDLSPVPVHLRLAVAATGFWLREAKPGPSQSQLQALVLGMVYGEMSWKSQSGANHPQHAVTPANWAAEHGVLKGLDRLRMRPCERRGMDVGAAHSFSQWQACLCSARYLNQVLLLPLPEPQLSWLFSGTLVHGLFKYLKVGQAAKSLLPGNTQSAQLYYTLLAAARKCGAKTQQHPSAGERGKRGRQRGRQGRGGRGARGACRGRGGGAEGLDNMFAALMYNDDSDDDGGW